MHQEELVRNMSQGRRVVQADDLEGFRARSYQLEMLEQSIDRNVIVAMDTGSGKTEIAVLRMRWELERCPNDKRIWFLAPTVALCEQQHRYIRLRLPDTSPLLLVGSSNVDYWSEQSIWDAALHNHRIVISTHAVLLDAMHHGFVQLASLALLVFDEGEFTGQSISTKLTLLVQAHHCGRKHAGNLIMQQFYHNEKRVKGTSYLPHILGLTASPVRRSGVEEIHQLEENLDSVCVTPRKYRQELMTYVHRPEFLRVEFSEDLQPVKSGSALHTLQILQRRAMADIESLLREVTLQHGPIISPRLFDPAEKSRWVRAVTQYTKKSERVQEELGPWATQYFIQKTNQLYSGDASSNVGFHCDQIFNKLLTKHFDQSASSNMITATLIDHPHSFSDKAVKLVNLLAQQGPETTGVIFVKERVIVSMLFQILSTLPQTAERFKFATFVGLSSNTKKKVGIHELLDLKTQNESLEAFRVKQKQIIIATDVLEEGIDVAACNLVVCFDPPLNLKSFIQRRGRARKQQSQFVIMQPHQSTKAKFDGWVQLEEELVRVCQDEERERQTVLAIENQDEHSGLTLRNELTGAMLSAEAIKAHLHHFCNTLPKQPFVETYPRFSTQNKDLDENTGLLVAKVVLPNCVGSFQRSHVASGEYRTERAAFQAAAYQCYKALCEATLVNDHYLPNIPTLPKRCQNLSPLIEVDEHIQPWRLMARAWSSPKLHRITIEIERKWLNDASPFHISLVTPMFIPDITSLDLKQHIGFTVKKMSTLDTKESEAFLKELPMHKQKMAALCLPSESLKNATAKNDFVYIFDLHHGLSSHTTPIEVVDVMGRIVRHIEKSMIADLLQTSILSACTFHDTAHIVAALTAPSADTKLNFERHEFLGDAVLKMVVSAQAFTDRITWPTGWLSQYRNNVLSNASLANSALSLHLDEYILIEAPRISGWLLSRISDADIPRKERTLSSKTLADVLQALIAAAYLDSGYSLARSCTKVFIPEVGSGPLSFEMPQGAGFPRHGAEEINKLTRYQFRNITVLLQALTHPSCASVGSEESYQRLAFLGDAVLEFLVSKTLFNYAEELSEGQMTEIRAAVVNSNMLGYICMAHGTSRTVYDITATKPKRCQKVRHVETMTLSKYMRHESKALGEAQKACQERYSRLCEAIQQHIQSGHTHPWVTLAELQPESFYSDLIHSVIGAIYVDSGEDWSACERFVDAIGISSYMRRIVQFDHDVIHPRSALQHLAPLAKVRSQRDDDGSFRCEIRVDEVEIATAESCRSKNEALILASHNAVQVLVAGRDARR